MKRQFAETLCLIFACLLLCAAFGTQAFAAEEDPYEYNAEASLIGGCGISAIDPIEDPGCPGGAHPPKKFGKPTAIATDAYGNEYVADFGAGGSPEGSEGRIDIFDSKGNFITEIADPFGPRGLAVDSKGNLYVVDNILGFTDEVTVYEPTEYDGAAGKIKYGPRTVIPDEGKANLGIAVDLKTDRLFVQHGTSISEYSARSGGKNELLDTITDPQLSSGYSLAIDAESRRLYSSSCPTGDIEECWVIVFDVDTQELIEEVTGADTPEEEFASNKGWLALAVDESDGSFFVGDLELTKRVYKFDADYGYVSTTVFPFQNNPPQQITVSNSPESAANHRFLYVPSLPVKTTYGHAFAFEPPSETEPEIESVSAGSIGETEAELRAQIEPNGGLTTYKFEYLTQQAYEGAGNSFTGATVAREGTLLGTQQRAKVTAAISGLAPGTAYRFRVTAKNAKGEDEDDAAFSTYDDVLIDSGPCPNEALRTALSVFLPDCRAYELVTPPDTNGRPPTGIGAGGDQFPTLQASPSGGIVSFITKGGTLPGNEGAGGLSGDLYRSTRAAGGWITHSAGASGTETSSPRVGSSSSDQTYSFWTASQEGPAMIEGEETNYIRYPDGHSELVGRGSINDDAQGLGKLIAEKATHIIFETRPINASDQAIQLEPNAPPTGTRAVYDRTIDPITGTEKTHVVSLLPGDVTPTAGEDASYVGASDDGEGIAFSIDGTLYLRVHNEETFEIGTGVAFAGVSEGGERIFYVEEGDLKAFNTAAEEEIAFTSVVGSVTPVNVAKDGSRAYFVFNNTIAGAGSNPEGKFAKAGQPNLFLSEEGGISFVATVTAVDVDGEAGGAGGLGHWISAVGTGELVRDPSRLNPDGSVMLFQSRANLTDYDPEGDPQIYRYDHPGDRLHCISCIPTGQPATGGASLQSHISSGEVDPPLGSSGFVPNITPNGDRVFFESTEALVSTDNNAVQDVYEWEEQGVGSCTTAGGCVYLITSGHSAKDNYLFGHSQSGDDVFFTTADILNGFDTSDTLSIYDAKVGGGFPEPASGGCEGEGCRPSLSGPPPLPRPESGVRTQSGNVPPGKRCPKSKKKVKRGGKVVCVKKKNKKNRKASKNGKGASK